MSVFDSNTELTYDEKHNIKKDLELLTEKLTARLISDKYTKTHRIAIPTMMADVLKVLQMVEEL